MEIVDYENLMRDPLLEADRVARFLNLRGVTEAMAGVVDVELWHSRVKS